MRINALGLIAMLVNRIRNFPLWIHSSISLLIVAVATLVYFSGPETFPDLDTPSAYIYLVASLLSALGTTKLGLKKSESFWLYAAVTLFCFFAFLEESSYGAEFINFHPFYLESHNVDMKDLHGVVGFLHQLQLIRIGENADYHEVWGNLLRNDTQIVIMAILSLLFLRLRTAGTRVAKYAALGFPIVFLIYGVLQFGSLAALPTDNPSQLLFGY
jgi:hypothetical protein